MNQKRSELNETEIWIIKFESSHILILEVPVV